MTSIEKKMIAAVVVCLVIIVLLFARCTQALNEAGGINGLLIEAGKELKDISHEIEKHDPNEQQRD